jgi:hypothetical protein
MTCFNRRRNHAMALTMENGKTRETRIFFTTGNSACFDLEISCRNRSVRFLNGRFSKSFATRIPSAFRMSDSNQFAVFQKESVGPTSDQLRRAFNSFTNLTDADAIRLANSARGILMKYMAHDAARALQLALQAEGVGVALVPESDVPRLPETRALHRLNLSPEALVTFDLLGRETKIPWTEIQLVAAGAVRHFEVSKTETERTVKRFGIGSKTVTDVTHKVESGSQLLLEIHLADGKTRFQIEAANFPFKYLIDQPSLSTL